MRPLLQPIILSTMILGTSMSIMSQELNEINLEFERSGNTIADVTVKVTDAPKATASADSQPNF